MKTKTTKTEPTKFFVAMRPSTDTGRLVCVPTYDPVTCNYFYAYTSRRWAEKHAKKNGADVYSVEGFNCEVEDLGSWLVKTNMSYKHLAIAEEAQRLFG